MRVAIAALMWVVLGAVICLPLALRRYGWLRIAAVLVVLGIAAFAWMGIVTSPRLAMEKAGVSSLDTMDRFAQGAFAARDVAVHMKYFFWGSLLGLAVLALVPPRPNK
jgi:hypothetical protein